MKIEELLTHEELISRLESDYESPVMTWKVKPGDERFINIWNSRYAGKVAGGEFTPNPECPESKMWKICIKVSGKKFHVSMHKLKWFYHHGSWPQGEIDHIDGNSLNNRVDNLRVVTRSENMMNTSLYKRNSSGVKGVSYDKSRGKWKAQIQKDCGDVRMAKRFDTIEEAKECYENWCKEIFGEYGNANGLHEDDCLVL